MGRHVQPRAGQAEPAAGDLADLDDDDVELRGVDPRAQGQLLGLVDLVVIELTGMAADAKQDAIVREKVRKAIDLILRAQRIPTSLP